MNISSYCFIVGSIVCFLIAVLHFALVLKPQWYRYFGADKLVQLHEQGSSFTVLVTLVLALMFAVWGVYGLSGAGVIRQLPFLRAALITIGVIFILRGLMLPSDIFKVLQSGYSFRFVVFSMTSLATGLLYLIGTLMR